VQTTSRRAKTGQPDEAVPDRVVHRGVQVPTLAALCGPQRPSAISWSNQSGRHTRSKTSPARTTAANTMTPGQLAFTVLDQGGSAALHRGAQPPLINLAHPVSKPVLHGAVFLGGSLSR
jgi:hypothetical protein